MANAFLPLFFLCISIITYFGEIFGDEVTISYCNLVKFVL